MTHLKNKFNFIKLANQHKTLRLTVALTDMPNVQDIVEQGSDAVAQVSLEFDKDEYGYRIIKGDIKMNLVLICQRCNQPMSYRLVIEPHLAIVRSEAEAKVLPKLYDPCIAEEDDNSIAELVEEEILLSLPMVAKHDACGTR
ncbi:MAG: YceD family protein [Gammaproteobacteria bacterium]|nr:YceD family protein [Gammaproteobacteria bacterium]MCH9744534.1 YceD family protein [Gammaproteobacteria bacterium]